MSNSIAANPMPSGETISSALRLEDVKNELRRLEAQLGLPPFAKCENEATELLKATRARLRGMSAEECGEAAAILAQLGFHIQRALNWHRMVVDWCRECIDRMLTGGIARATGWKFEERRLHALRESKTAQQVDALWVRAQTRLDPLH